MLNQLVINEHPVNYLQNSYQNAIFRSLTRMTGHFLNFRRKGTCTLKDKKQLIINAAIKCFAQKGFHSTSIQEIVDTAGIAKGSVYSYFKSKEDLLFVALKREYDRMMSEIFTVANDKNLSPKE